MEKNTFSKKAFWSRPLVWGTTVSGAILFFMVGIIFWGGFNTGMEATNNTEFCIGCHEMEANVYKEYIPTIHYSNRTGVRAGCPDCHVPKPWVHKFVRKIKASRELIYWATGKIDTKEKFEEHRLDMAKRVWAKMEARESRECRNCHDFDTMLIDEQGRRARRKHQEAQKEGGHCIQCHKGVVHEMPKGADF